MSDNSDLQTSVRFLPDSGRRPYCEDCRFFAAGPTGKNYGRCHAPDAKPTGIDHLISREYPEHPYATVMRVAQCGPEAKWFEPTPGKVEAA